MRLAALILLAALTGCASTIHDERVSLLAEPIDCASADADIAALEAAMPSKGERAKSMVQTVVPIGAIASVATGSYRDRANVLTGRTQDELSARIEEIKATCGIEEPSRTGTE
jgi:hypothetical protein